MNAPNRSLLSVMTSCIAAAPAESSAPAGRSESDSAPPLTSFERPARTQAPKASHRRSMVPSLSLSREQHDDRPPRGEEDVADRVGYGVAQHGKLAPRLVLHGAEGPGGRP